MKPPLAVAWASLLLAYGLAAAWLWAHPAAIPSDDALFFARALTRFSVIDLSPQFPGYPGFVALGRVLLLLWPDPVRALAATTDLLALAIPPLTALAARRTGAAGWLLVLTLALALANPLLPDLGLSLMSDGAGILGLLLALALLPAGPEWRAMPYLAGLALGAAMACRPSDLALFAGAFVGAALCERRLALPLIAGGLVAVLPAAVAVYATEGPLYLAEATRFVTGHAQAWGNTPFAAGGRHGGWLGSIAGVPGGGVLAVLLVAGVASALAGGRLRSPVLAACLGAFLAHAVWIAGFQNPDHLRHLAPLVVLGGLILPLLASRVGALLAVVALAAELVGLAGTLDAAPGRAPPLARLAEHLEQAPAGAAVVSNEGVSALREALPGLRVYDRHYPADAALGLATATVGFEVLTGPKAGSSPEAVFAGRCAGEAALYLYRVR